MNVSKEIRGRNMQISIATKKTITFNCSQVFVTAKQCHNTKMTQPQGALILQGE